jgi:hypothetical protein
MLLTLLGVAGSGIGAAAGGGLIAAGAAGQMAVGGGSDMAVLKSTLADASKLSEERNKLKEDIAIYGSII